MKQPPVTISHVGLRVIDMDKMVGFYTRVLGLHVTDRAHDGRMTFLSGDPSDHHQLFLVRGAETGERETRFAHVAFRVRDMGLLREIGKRVESEPEVSDVHEVTHGNAWSIYFQDPEGNAAEAFVDTPWHVAQPFRVEMDITKQSDDAIRQRTDKLLDAYPTRRPFEAWRKDFAKKLGID